MKPKKLDVFNFFYSIGAVIILIGVIAKFLEWKAQDILLLTGLGVEALVFSMSAIQYKQSSKEYQWDRIFPELVDGPSQPTSLTGIQESIESVSKRYQEGLNLYMTRFEELNNGILNGTNKYHESLNSISDNLSQSAYAFSDLKGSIADVTASFNELNNIGNDIKQLQMNLQSLTGVSILSGDKLNKFQEQLQELNDSIYRFNMLSTGIIHQFKQIGN